MRAIISVTSNLYKKYQFQIWLVLGLRIGYSFWLAMVWLVIDKYIPLSEGVLWETYYNLERSSTLLGRAFIDVWLRWDAVHYMNIAAFGYEGVGVGDTVFFPLYPYLVGLISRFTSMNVTLVGIIISSISTLIALIFLFDLVVELFQDERLAKWSIVCLAFYPTAFFLHAPYTDALFLSVSVGSILMMVKRKPILAGLLACAAGLTRAQGLLLIIPMIIFYFQDYAIERKCIKWRELLSLFMAIIGWVLFALWRMKTGVVGFFETYQEYSKVAFGFPLVNIFMGIKRLFNSPSILELAELFSVLLFLAILIWMFTHEIFRKNLAIMMYSLATWLLITSKITLWASPFQCSNRYILHIFFAFVGIAAIILKLSERKQKLKFLLTLTISLVLSTLYGLWIFIG